MSVFSRKKSLDKITSGELNMAKAELEYTISGMKKSLASIDIQIGELLEQSKQAETEYEIECLAKDAGDLIVSKREMRAELDAQTTRLKAVDKLIRIKNEGTGPFARKKDLFDKLNVDRILQDEDDKAEDNEVAAIRAEKLLRLDERNADYDMVLQIFRAVNLDDESAAVAKAELEGLTAKQIV